MISKLLIANRGEIAVRVIETCRKMGVVAVAVYSEADRNAKYVSMADEAYCIGAPEAATSYLDGQKIIELAKRIGVDGIHPGYGFLSENAGFVELCEDNDIAFVGPRADVVERMGSKIESKRIAMASDVPTVPGYTGDDQSPETLIAEAERIGTPLMIKASAGGGGRGMRIVHDLNDFATQLELATKEAQTAFGDARVLLERFIEESRHLEVQVLGDNHGNVVHLFERECSIQRNHQKVIEEAPAGFIDNNTRERLYSYALQLSKEIDYNSAGTVEFIFDNKTKDIFFLEMNTRLQVEHPVTELISGIDLVEWQIRIASGEQLALQQNDLAINGWAIEARVTAENPAEDYRPETGTLTFYREPQGKGIRIDSGIEEGSVITPFYDSMISKTIAYGETREEARSRLIVALGEYLLAGVGNNIPFLRDILKAPAFSNQPLTTNFINHNFEGGWRAPVVEQEKILVLAALAWIKNIEADLRDNQSPWHSLKSWRLLRNSGHQCVQEITIRDRKLALHNLKFVPYEDSFQVTLNDHETIVNNISYTGEGIEAEIGGALVCYRSNINDQQVILANGSISFEFEVVPQRQALAGDARSDLTGEYVVRAPMPGVIEALPVKVGDSVKKGDVVVVMESMKLVQNLCVSADGVISGIHCEIGQNVEANSLLVGLDIAEDSE